jgi:cyclopropane fatty-acyl-phospholipid synthase-like methyltransferase
MILDLGCGIGQFLYYLSHAGYTNLVGMDISESQIALARQMQPNLDFQHVQNPIDELLRNPEKFDAIVMNDVLEHIAPETLLGTMKAVCTALKTKGFIIIKTINAAYPLGNFARYQDLTHRSSYHEKSLTQLLRQIGFNRIECHQEEIGLYNPLFVIKKSIVMMVRFVIKLMIYFTESDWPGIISVNIIAHAQKK